MLTNLKFGRDDAESEQEFLQQVFFPTALFKRVKKNDKWLVLGRKGSGKTALCLTLFRELQNEHAYVSLIEPANFSVATQSILNKGSINFSEASKLSWKYVFLTELGKYVLEAVIQKEGKNQRQWTEEARKVREFLVKGDNRFASWLDKALKKTSEFTKFALEIATIKAEAERTPMIQEASALRDTLDETSQYIEQCMKRYFGQPIYILIDKVDEIWNQSPESSDLIIGLLKAAKECREKIPHACLVVFLRSDIFETLKFDDLDKFRSIGEKVVWDGESLLKLISLRINASIGEKLDANHAWQKAFPKTIGGENSFSYLLNYTLLRPRDLIQLCNRCKDIAENHNFDKIDQEAVIKALPEYSRWKLDDLAIEYRVQYPFLEKVFWNVFYRAPHRFDFANFKKRITPRLAKWSSESGGEYFKPLEKLLEVLYRIGFVGAIKPGKILYFYNAIPVTISDTREFIIHPAFRPALEIVESIEHMKTIKIGRNSKGIKDKTKHEKPPSHEYDDSPPAGDPNR